MGALLLPLAAQAAGEQEIAGRWEGVVAVRRDTLSGTWNTAVGDRQVSVPNAVRHVNLGLVEQFDFHPNGIVRFVQQVVDDTRVFEKTGGCRLVDVTDRFPEVGREKAPKVFNGFYVFRRESGSSGVLTIWFPDTSFPTGSEDLARFGATISGQRLSLQDSKGEVVHYTRAGGISGPPSDRRDPAADAGGAAGDTPRGGSAGPAERVVTVHDTVVMTVHDTVVVGDVGGRPGTTTVYDTVKVFVRELVKPAGNRDIPGLSAISVSPRWADWDADAEADGIQVRIFPKDILGGAILRFEDGIPLTVEVKLHTDNNRDGRPEEPPVYSAVFQGTAADFLRSRLVRVPETLIAVNPDRDYRYGIMDVSLTTPKQGTFSARAPFVELYQGP